MEKFKTVLLNSVVMAVLISAPTCITVFAQPGLTGESEVLGELRNDNLSYYKELVELRKKHPQVYKKIISGEIKKQRFMTEMRESNPEVYKKLLRLSELEKKVNDLSRAYLETNSNERKAELKNEIKNQLSELFGLKEEKYAVELNELENQIKTLKNKMNKRKENKEKIINKRLENLTSNEESLDW